MSRKPLAWIGSSLQDVRRFPADARRIAGHQLHLVQEGLDPGDAKPMKAVGTGVYEIRIRTKLAHRVFYIAKFAEAVYVLHAFEKRRQKTAQADIAIAMARLKHLIQRRGRNEG